MIGPRPLFVHPGADEDYMIDQPFPPISQKMASRDPDIHKGATEENVRLKS
jgi:hypothetical protein